MTAGIPHEANDDPAPAVIRTAGEADAPAFMALLRRVCAETTFMATAADEITRTDAEQAAQFARNAAAGGATFLCERDGALVGFLGAQRGIGARWRHSLHIHMGIVQDETGRGLGGLLLRAAEDLARSQGVTRLELTVMADNVRAIRLYEKCGFEREGVRRAAARIGDRHVDVILMAKLLAG